MSGNKTVKDYTGQIMEADAKNAEHHHKKSVIEKYTTDTKYDQIVESQETLKKAQSIDVTLRDPDRIKKIQESVGEYFRDVKNSRVFINNDFRGKIPYFLRNIILLAAETGQGKSTICANLALHALSQGQRALVISNEENEQDIYNRITCLFKSWSYTDHTMFSPDQVETFQTMIEHLSHRLTVIDDSFDGAPGATSTIEGVENILNSLVDKEIKFDVIIVDYYQNIERSIKNPMMSNWQVQERFCNFIDKFKNRYDAPIIILAQKKKDSEDMSFKESIEGRKIILNKATCAINVKADRENLKTGFTVEKSRFPEAMGQTIWTGYNKGKYVPYDQTFKNHVQDVKDRREERETLGKIKPKSGGDE